MVSRESESSTLTKTSSYNFPLVGFENIGNTWYFNVVLQCLFHLKDFNKIFDDGSYQKMLNPYQKSNVWNAYTELLK